MSIAIQVENISKAYQIGEFSTGTITNDIDRWWKLLRGKEDPYLKIGETNDRSTKGESNVVWSLKDINFDIQQGDAVGIIGKNGAGKSTLLKILSRTTSPTTGSVKIKGKVASLLEVGTGFHPELSGRENVFLNGAILGMRKHEIKKHFDSIVDFSGVERYIDTPVKRYSSGMYVRLAFAVAAHLVSEILIVDEVLAVGDAEFQKKCLGKMGDVSKNEGRTVLFVSHNLAAVKSLCTKSILLSKGEIEKIGNSESILNYYQETEANNLESRYSSNDNSIVISDGNVKLKGISIVDHNKKENRDIRVSSKIGVIIEYEILNDFYKPDVTIFLSDLEDFGILHAIFKTDDYTIGDKRFIVWFPENFFNNIQYKLLIGITTSNPVKIHFEYAIKFEVDEDFDSPTRVNIDYRGKYHGVLRPLLKLEKI